MTVLHRSATQSAYPLSLPIPSRPARGLLFLLLSLALMAGPAWAMSVTLEWDANPQPELRGYKVYCRLSSDKSYDYEKPVWAGTDGHCEVTGLAPSTDYCFVVRAFDADGNESGDSNEVFYPGSQITVPDTAEAGADESDTEQSPQPATDTEQSPQPNTPVPSPMSEEAVNTPLEPLMENASQPENAAKAAHTETHWQVFRDEGTPAQGGVYDVHSHRALDQLPLPPLVLEEATAYFWRSRYVNDDGSSGEWAAPQHFTTGVRDGDGDGDGILDAQAVAADADLNGDGIFDGTQIKLRGVNTLIGGGSVAVDASEDAQVLDIESVLALDPADPALGGGNSYDLPLGLVAFRLALAEGIRSVAVTLHLSHPPGDKMDLLTYDAARGWQSMADLAQPIDDDGRVVRLTLTDGGREDVDGVENGRIIFTGGYGRAVDYRGPDDDAVAAAVGDRGEAEVMGASPCFIGTAGP